MNIKAILCSKPATRLGSRFEAELLLAHVLGLSRTTLIARSDQEVEPTQQSIYETLVNRRLLGEPIAYITGEKEFWSLSFLVTPAVLIPRPETELLIETMLTLIPRETPNIQVLELGTGSGAIAIAVALECPSWKVIAVDKSTEALKIAKENVKRLMPSGPHPIEFYESDWFSHFSKEEKPPLFNIIVSNPPYIALDDSHLQQADLTFEPQQALVSGKDGLEAIRQIISQAPGHLASKSWLLLEHGFQQAAAVRALLQNNGFTQVKTLCDLAGKERITIAYRP